MKRALLCFGLVFGALAGTVLFSPSASAASFDPAHIIDDAVFYNSSSMSAADIQNFLNSKLPSCDTGGAGSYGGTTRSAYAASKGESTPFTCLKDYYENPSTHANNLHGASIPAGSLSAAQIIYSAAQQYGVNPQALLVTLQKENGLITDDWPWTFEYNTAMGFGCPDSGPNNSANCNAQYYGFYNQIFLAAKQFRNYATNPNDFNYVAGTNNYIQYNPSTACGGTNVLIQNQATAGLYDYTPYQPNAAALAAGYGSSTDGCGAYGNRNFFNYFTDWFGTTYNQITYVQVQGGSGQYIIYNGRKQALTYDGLLAWGINRLPLVTMSQSVLDAIPSYSTPLTRLATVNGTSSMVFADGTNYYDINSGTLATWGNFKNTPMSTIGWPLISFAYFKGPLPFVVNIPNDSHQYLMENGILQQLSSADVLHAWGANSSVNISSTYAQGVATGSAVTHNLVSSGGKTYYLSDSKAFLVPNSVAALFSDWQPYPISAASLGRYIQSGTLSHLIKSPQSGVIYAVDNTTKHPIGSFDVFMALRNTSAYETSVSDYAMNILPVGAAFNSAVLQPQGTSTYYVANGSLAQIPSRLIPEYNLANSSVVSSNFIALFTTSSAPASQFVKRSGSSVVYFVSQGTKIPINRYDVLTMLGGQNNLTTLADTDFNGLTTSANAMTPVVSNGGQNALIDQSNAFTYTSNPLAQSWGIGQTTAVSASTYSWFTTNYSTAPLSNHIQAPNGEFCFVDGGRSCAEQYYMIFNWNLLNGVIHPSATALSYFNINRSGALSSFVSSPSGQAYASNVFMMIDGVLYYVTTPSSLANLGFTGSLTDISTSSIDAAKTSAFLNGYLFKDTNGSMWAMDAGARRLVPSSLSSNWTGASVQPLNVSTAFINLYPSQKTDLTRSVTSSGTGTIYGIDSGQKRGITTYQKYAQSWSPYTSVSSTLLGLIPNGPDY